MASKLISIFLGLQCWSPALLPCPFPHRSDGNREHFPPHFPFLGMKECQTWSWHVQLHQSVYVNRHQHATPKWFLYHDQTTCVYYSVSGTPSRSQGWLCQFPEISLMPIQAHCSACVYIWGLHTAARTHLISFCHSQHQLRVRVQWIKPWAKARCSEAEKRPAPAGSLFLMVSLDKLSMLDTASLYSL